MKAVINGIDTLDFRGLQGMKKLWETPEFSGSRLPETLVRIRDAGLVVSGISTSVRLLSSEAQASGVDVDETRRSLDLACSCGAGR